MIGVFTYTLWKNSAEQSRLTRDTINLAREEFIASHRPLIVVRGIILMEPTNELQSAQMIFTVHNTGSSLAIVTEIIFFMSARQPNDLMWPSIKMSSPALPARIKPGYDIRPSCDIDSTLWTFWPEEEAGAVDGKQLTLRITNNYEDVMGARKQTSVHRQYDWGASRFDYVIGSDLEYQT